MTGEPTPYQWPDINSHFGILDIAGFPKDRFFWYRAWFVQPATPAVWVFPHWSWDARPFNLPVWVYSNADEVELFVNGVSAGRKAMPQYGHAEWSGVKYAPGSLAVAAYSKGAATPRAWAVRNTTGAPTALRISIKDGVGTQLIAGCRDVALVQVEVVDAKGLVVPDADHVVTFDVSGPARLAGTGNGDPACHVSDLSATRPAFHGLVLGVVAGGTEAGMVTVTASAPGVAPATLFIAQAARPADMAAYWCHTNPML